MTHSERESYLKVKSDFPVMLSFFNFIINGYI
jgi:hypothetical protein